MFKNVPEFKANNSGAKEKKTFTRIENPVPHIEATGKMNVYDYIQSFTEQTDYTSMLEKMDAGDPVAQARATSILANCDRKEQYGDDSRTYGLNDIYNSVVQAKTIYDGLGGNSKLGLTFQEFLSSAEIIRGKVSDFDQAPAPAPEPAPAPAPEGGEQK